MGKMRLPKCTKCGKRCTSHCHYCGDAVCFYHLHVNEQTRIECGPCGIKFYMAWRQEQEDATTQTEEYESWMLRKMAEESAIGSAEESIVSAARSTS